MSGKLKIWLWSGGMLAVAAVVTLLYSGDICPLLDRVCPLFSWSGPGMAEWIRVQGSWGMAASVGLMVAHSFIPFPAELLTLANGLVYGPWLGTLVTWIGAMFGAFASFGLTRWLGRPFVLKVLSRRHLCRLDEWSSRQGVTTLLLARLLPVISFNLVNYAAGLTPISWWTFAWTTGLGILPMTVLMVAMGSRLHLLPWWIWLLAGLVLLLLWIVWSRRENPQICEID
jgi:uncharacterized membrane protein YdjX (TVP38/TMEM64 family)